MNPHTVISLAPRRDGSTLVILDKGRHVVWKGPYPPRLGEHVRLTKDGELVRGR